jgi:hypothetical protein
VKRDVVSDLDDEISKFEIELIVVVDMTRG